MTAPVSGCTVNFSNQYPLNLDIQVRNANVVTTGSPRRSIGSVATSWGSQDTTWTSYNINSAPIGTVQDQIDWRFSGTLPGAGLGDNEADLAINFGDGVAISAGTTIDSRKTGNYATAGAGSASLNGVF